MSMTDPQRRRLGCVVKAFDRKLGGEEKFGDQLKDLIPVGPFEEKVVVICHVRGTKGEDSPAVDRFFGVSHNDMIDMAIGMFGCTENAYRRLAAACIERKRAELEERDIQDVTYQDSEGVDQVLTADEIVEAIDRAEERKERMAEDVETPAFSELVKKKVRQKGRIEVAYVGARTRIATPEELKGIEHLKQTKADAEAYGTLCEPKARKPRKKKEDEDTSEAA